MATVEMFDHTADVGLRISADSVSELFRIAAEAMFDYIVVNRTEVLPSHFESVRLEADSPADLLALWLNELIFRCETTHRLYSQFEIEVDEVSNVLTAVIRGEDIDRERHILDHEVKAVTQHGLALSCTKSTWFAELILDI